MRRTSIIAAAGLVAPALAGCGGDEHPAAKPTPSAHHAAVAAKPRRQAPEAIYMFRVLGDDPLPDTVTVRRDGSTLVVRGGGHGGSQFVQVVLPRRERRKVLRLARRAPLPMLRHNTIEPGGFGGWDNTMRYLIRRGKLSVGVERGRIPRPIRPLVRELDRIIEFDVGRIAHRRMQSGVDLG